MPEYFLPVLHTLALSLSLPCLWPFALCTSNGWGVIHWLICWQPVWQGISFVSLPTMLLPSVCVSERASGGKKTEWPVCMWNMFVKLCLCDWGVSVGLRVCCSMSNECSGIKLILWRPGFTRPFTFPFFPLCMSAAALFTMGHSSF